VLNVAKARQIGGYRFDLHVEEYDMYWRMALTQEVRFIPETLVGYRMHGNSICALHDYEKEAAILYIQYLLLSTLWNLEAERYENVQSSLQTLVNGDQLKYRAHMRNAMTSLGQRQYLGIVRNAYLAMQASPRLFARRVMHQLGQRQTVRIGGVPEKFLSIANQLWPNANGSLRIAERNRVSLPANLAL
jgi:hypothetical protein